MNTETEAVREQILREVKDRLAEINAKLEQALALGKSDVKKGTEHDNA